MIFAILFIGLFLRLILINQSFWLDEAASLVIARLPLNQLFSAINNDFHPPLYYLLLHYWLKLGITNEWFLRLPNVIFGVLSIWVLYLILNQLKTKSLHHWSLIGTLLLALNPLHIYYSQELRMYSLNILLSLLSWYYLIQKKPSFWALFTTLNFFTFYGAFFNLIAQLVFVFLYQRPRFKKFVPYSLISLVLFLPWLGTLSHQLSGGYFLKSVLPEWSKLSGNLNLKTVLLIPLKFSLGRLNLSTSNLYLFTATITSLYFFSLILLCFKHKKAKPFLIWLITPLVIGLLVSLKTPILGYWRFLYLLPAFCSLIALGINLLPGKLRVINLFVVITTLLLVNVLFWLSPPSHRENWRTALNYVKSFDQTNTTSIFAFSDAFAPVRWYAPEINYVAPLKNLNSDPENLDLVLSRELIGYDEVIYFNYLSPLTDSSGNIATWLNNAGYSLKQTTDFPGVGFVYVYTSFKSRN